MITEANTTTVERIEHLNQSIWKTLIEVIPQVSPEIQLEISYLSEQIHCINQLILKSQGSSLKKSWKSQKDPQKFYFLLEEVQAILMLAKSKTVSPETLQNFRLKLEKQINLYRHPFWGHGLNGIAYLYHIKSPPFKIFLGLLITTFTSITILIFFDQVIYRLDYVNPDSPTNLSINSPNTQAKTNSATFLRPNKHLIWYGLAYAATAGTLGSIASILFRIIDFRDEKYDDPLVPFFIGLFKPLIGLTLGLFVASLIASDTVFQIDALITSGQNSPGGLTNEARHDLFIFSCAFLVGFSERFASDFLKKAESSLGDKQGASQMR
jgi:hypothetical protein